MKTLAKQGFLLLALLVAISNSSERSGLVEELEEMFDSPYTKYNTKTANDDGGDDAMSDDKSLNADDDKEMMEPADTSHVMRYLPIFSGVIQLIQWTTCALEKFSIRE